MTLQEAIKSGKRFKLPNHDYSIKYYLADEGPQKNLVECDYFIIIESDEFYFSTNLDLYPEEILSNDWEVLDEPRP